MASERVEAEFEEVSTQVRAVELSDGGVSSFEAARDQEITCTSEKNQLGRFLSRREQCDLPNLLVLSSIR